MKNLIFVEGVSGVGKTTMVQKVCDILRNMGYVASCHLEGDPNSPLDLCWVAYLEITEYKDLLNNYPQFADDLALNVIYQGDYVLLRYQFGRTNLYSPELHDELHKREFCYNPTNTSPLQRFTEVFLNLWTRFVESVETPQDYVIFDASLVSHMTNDLMRNYNAPEDELVAHLEVLLTAIQPLNPIVFYLSSQSVRERLIDARKNRGQSLPTEEQILFWEKRKRNDLPVLSKLPVESHILDISDGNWDPALDMIITCIKNAAETDQERQARIYPIILNEYNPAWPEWYTEEKTNLERLIGVENIARISHFGSTSVPGLTAKPTVDIMLELAETVDIEKIIALMPEGEYITLRREGNSLSEHDRIMIIKGYTDTGFADKVFHIHVRNPGDWDELYFRDYLIAHPKTIAEYAELKRSLFKEYEHNRDGYTAAKGAFIKKITEKARELV